MVNANWEFYEVRGSCQALFDLAFDPQVLFFNRRQEKAQLLGFQNFAQLSLDSKMAGNPSEVWKMITDLHSKSKEAAESELQILQVNQIIVYVDCNGKLGHSCRTGTIVSLMITVVLNQ